VAYANRSACFLKLGEHERALADAERCVKIEPGFVKGRFRIGLALHALGRFAEAAAALAEAETLDPKNAQIKDALKMAAFKARQKGAMGGS
jgi:cytochrome c-type biogenesis protein CcmH/NrfG